MSSDAAIDAAEERAGLRNPGYEIFIAALSVLSILNLVLMYTIKDQDLDYVLMIMNAPITLIFFIDFLYRLKSAPSKSDYFWRNWGWADLLASLPFQQTKILRLFRLVKVYRLLQDYGAKNIARSLIKDKAGSALLSLLFIAILVLEFGSLLMLRLEGDVEGSNITTASDAIWYIVVTMSTVGYGDQYPITNPGRVLGTVIIVVGVGIFGTLTGYLANVFLSPGKSSQEGVESSGLEAKLRTLKELNEQQQAAIVELETMIEGR
jgi:voltage-gated potassium channel